MSETHFEMVVSIVVNSMSNRKGLEGVVVIAEGKKGE